MHVYHEELPGYSAGQILHDGCPECEDRSREPGHGIARLDTVNFARAWARAAQWNLDGCADLARAEIPMLNAIWTIQIQLERYGVPIGVLPSGLSGTRQL